MYCSCKPSKSCEELGIITICSFRLQHEMVDIGGLGEEKQSYVL